MPIVHVGSCQIFYHERGQTGPRLLFLHGAGGTWQNWGLQVRDLDGARRVAIDLPGHGHSEGEGRASISAYSDVVLAFLGAIEWPAATLVGHSMGGAIAQWVALHAPDRVERLILVGTGASLPVHPEILTGLGSDDPSETLRRIVEWAYRPDATNAELHRALQALQATPAAVTCADFVACDGFDVRERVAAIQPPTLVLTGEADRLTPPAYAEFLAEQLPNATLRLIPDAGHFVMLERPEVTTEVLSAFLSTPPPPSLRRRGGWGERSSP